MRTVPDPTLMLQTSASRRYTLYSATALVPEAAWTPIPGQINIQGSGGVMSLMDSSTGTRKFYRARVRVPYSVDAEAMQVTCPHPGTAREIPRQARILSMTSPATSVSR